MPTLTELAKHYHTVDRDELEHQHAHLEDAFREAAGEPVERKPEPEPVPEPPPDEVEPPGPLGSDEAPPFGSGGLANG